MPQQAPLRLVKRWQRYWPRSDAAKIPPRTRGFYVLYKQRPRNQYEVTYIGIAGVRKGKLTAAIASRIKSHAKRKAGWTHFSFFEVHDNISGDEIRELEALLLQIFRHDSRIKLTNVQKGSRKFSETRKPEQWNV